ncbi:hypothetical protein NDU88_011108 [Pleurodeles waltl]|uniref:Uncharacterized protein n=1 Tax=Pleurodeles waltl TaxID=8319 RepID=A0AAV7PWS6_PLEWA|nr:hypothetical protein NDU88_011108 [Pleurodeles waltl]
MASSAAFVVHDSAAASADAHLDTAMEHILQENAAVGHCLEALDSKITDLSTASNSILASVASFQDKVTDLDHCLTDVEGQLATLLKQDSELQFLRTKLTDLEDRSQKDNIHFFGIPELKGGTDIRDFLRDILPELTGLISFQALEFQWAHRICPPHKADSGYPAPSSHAFSATNKRAR